MYSYDGLKTILKEKGLTKTALAVELGISSRTIAKVAKGEKIGNITLRKISKNLGCKPNDLFREVSENAILQILRDEKNAKVSDGLYHEQTVE
jgi:DNA-binding Xre family transcriptional regulator